MPTLAARAPPIGAAMIAVFRSAKPSVVPIMRAFAIVKYLIMVFIVSCLEMVIFLIITFKKCLRTLWFYGVQK